MARRKIAILGGGVASLTTAFELTRTPELAARHDVTVYQMGWRIGGKGASGRNLQPHRGKRIEEHGLHVWLGFYENAFAMIKEVYAARTLLPDEALLTWRDAFKPQSFTPIGQKLADGAGVKWTYWGVDWPTNGDEPGDGKVLLSPWGALTELLSILERIVARLGEVMKGALAPPPAARAAPPPEHLHADVPPPKGLVANLGRRMEEAVEHLVEGVVGGAAELAGEVAGEVETVAELIVPALVGAAELLAAGPLQDAIALFRQLPLDPNAHDPKVYAAVSAALLEFRTALRRHLDALASAEPELEWLWHVIDLGIAVFRGVLDPKYGLFPDYDLERLDAYDFRAWLIENGATPEIVNDGSEVRALYDLPFAYEDGQLDQPSFAAGTALRAVLRIVATYKGAVLYLMQAGMGETVMAPLYEVLRARGVKFELFHKVKKLELSPNKNVVARVRIERQARTVGGKPYEATFRVKGVTAWPSEPFWEQLEDGAQLRDAGINFESKWNPPRPPRLPAPEDVVLEVGRDFDDVVLGISLGAFKKLNNEPTMCDELYEANPRFAAMANALSLVPTQAVQLWTTPTLAGLGWRAPKPAGDALPEILDVWADMSQELPREDWGAKGPGSIQYFCSIYPTTLYRRPTTDTSVPAQALAGVRATAIDWFSKYTGWMWPAATTAPGSPALDYGVLYDPQNGAGEARLDAQWLRANVDPTECFIASVKGTTYARLGADESGFVNLVLAGDWTKNGINAGCVEAAVMSGMSASRAICGSPRQIVGEDFFRKPQGGTDSIMGNLPAYVSGRRHGEQSIEPPGIIRGGDLSVFLIEGGDMGARQAFVDTMLNLPTGGKVRYSLLGSTALVLFMRAPKLTSPTEIVGYIEDQECSIALPLIELNSGSIALWMPYVFINSSLGMVTGREVWGYPKEISTFEFPKPEDQNPRFVASATIFDKLSQTTQGRLAPLVTVHKEGPMGPRVPKCTEVGAAFEEIVSALTGGTGKLLAHVAQEAFDVASLFGSPSLPVVNFKQFRDAVDPTRACYQAIVDGPLRIDELTGLGLLGDGYRLSITPCESHTIAADLGIANDVPVRFAYFVDLGFSAMPGRIVWKAP